MVIIDTTVWVDYLRGIVTKETSWFENELKRQRFGLTDLILCEILQGVTDESKYSVSYPCSRFMTPAAESWLLRQQEISGCSANGAEPFARRLMDLSRHSV